MNGKGGLNKITTTKAASNNFAVSHAERPTAFKDENPEHIQYNNYTPQ